MKRHQDVTIGIVILLFCAFFTCCDLRMDMGPALMPLILSPLWRYWGSPS